MTDGAMEFPLVFTASKAALQHPVRWFSGKRHCHQARGPLLKLLSCLPGFTNREQSWGTE